MGQKVTNCDSFSKSKMAAAPSLLLPRCIFYAKYDCVLNRRRHMASRFGYDWLNSEDMFDIQDGTATIFNGSHLVTKSTS